MTPKSTRKITYVSLTEECYNQIKADILNNVLQWGEQLDVVRFADDFGVSRSPVIKAIERLALEGLVEIRPNKGSYVQTPTEHDVTEVTEMRIAIEKMACKLAYTKNQNQLIAALDKNERLLEPFDRDPLKIPFGVFLEYDHAFHLIFAQYADNVRLLDIFKIVRSQSELFRTKTFLNPQTQVALQRHSEILEHLRTGQLDEAIKFLQTHIEEVRLDTLRSMEDCAVPETEG